MADTVTSQLVELVEKEDDHLLADLFFNAKGLEWARIIDAVNDRDDDNPVKTIIAAPDAPIVSFDTSTERGGYLALLEQLLFYVRINPNNESLKPADDDAHDIAYEVEPFLFRIVNDDGGAYYPTFMPLFIDALPQSSFEKREGMVIARDIRVVVPHMDTTIATFRASVVIEPGGTVRLFETALVIEGPVDVDPSP